MGAAAPGVHARRRGRSRSGATVWLYRLVPKGFFPQQDTGMMMGTTEAAQDISFAGHGEAAEQGRGRSCSTDPGGGHARLVHRLRRRRRERDQQRAHVHRPQAAVRAQGERRQSSSPGSGASSRSVEGINLFMQSIQDIRVGRPREQGAVPIRAAEREPRRAQQVDAAAARPAAQVSRSSRT